MLAKMFTGTLNLHKNKPKFLKYSGKVFGEEVAVGA